MQHQQIFAHVRARPGMWVTRETYDAVVGFVQGYDAACEGGVLYGFREWLVVRLGRPMDNLSWPPLVLSVAFPEHPRCDDAVHESEAAERHAIETMFALITEFDEIRTDRDGLAKVLVEHARLMKGKAG